MIILARRVLRVVTFVAWCCVTSKTVNAEQWPVLPNGRSVITVFNERVALSPLDTGNDKYSKVVFRQNGTPGPSRDLNSVIRDPHAATELFNTKVHDLAFLRVVLEVPTSPQAALDPSRPFLGTFPWKDIPRGLPTNPLQFNILPDNILIKSIRDGKPFEQFVHQRLKGPPYLDVGKPIRVTPEGFSMWHKKSNYDSLPGDPDDFVYVLPGSERLTPSQYPFVAWCHQWPGSSPSCSTAMLTKDERVRLFMYWNSGGERNEFPISTWKKLDDDLRKVASHIFIDRKMGDFE